MTYQEHRRRWMIDYIVRGIIYMMAGYAIGFLVQGGIVGILLAICLAWAVLKSVPR